MTGVQTCALPICAVNGLGVQANGAAGTVSVGDRLVAITGCATMGSVGNVGVFYWSLIDDNESANWQNIDTTESADWQLITTE